MRNRLDAVAKVFPELFDIVSTGKSARHTNNGDAVLPGIVVESPDSTTRRALRRFVFITLLLLRIV